MPRSAIDTNVLLRATLGDSPAQALAARALIDQSPEPLELPDVVVIEYVHVLESYYGFSRTQIVDLLGDIIAHPQFSLHENVISAAADLYLQHPKLSFTDCFLAEETRSEKLLCLYTFDRKLATQHDMATLIPPDFTRGRQLPQE